MKRILIVGATSAIAQAVARRWAAQGHSLYLVARDEERVEAIAADLRVRGARATAFAVLDLMRVDQHAELIDNACATLGEIDIALIAHGCLPDQPACERDAELALREIGVNALSVISLLTHLANRMEGRRGATLAVIGSVAGDRGRQSNYVYGTAKAAVATFLQGLRNRMHGHGISVLTIKPGFVDTPMTAAFRKGPLWASADRVAAGIVRAIERRADIVYLPGFWRLIMLAIRLVPEWIFKRLVL